MADQPGTASYTPSASSAFNSAGGAITATQSSVGHYAMHFAGLQNLTGHPEHVQVAARQQGSLAACNVVSWDNAVDGFTVLVECRDEAGQFKNTRYNVLVIE